MLTGADATLWLGIDRWPVPAAIESALRNRSFDPWDGLGFEQLQVGGLHCIQRRVYGLKLHVPSSDSLAKLLLEYRSTSFPGQMFEESSTPLEEVVNVKSRLADLGLVLDPVKYADFGEAYLPIEVQSAWKYSRLRRFPVFLHPHEGAGHELGDCESIGLSELRLVEEYLAAYWEKIVQDHKGGDATPARWIGVANCGNSD